MILITGASGLLGGNFIIEATSSGHQVVGAFLNHCFSMPGAESRRVDLRDEQATESLVQEFKPDWIVHCAAATDVDWCEANCEATWRTNVAATAHVARAARKSGSRLVLISTDSVFDGMRGDYSEKDKPRPLNKYAQSKAAAETMAFAENPDTIAIRTSIYGWSNQDKQSLAEWIFFSLLDARPVPAFRDVMFSPILANDLAQIALEMMRRNLTGIFHVGGANSCSKLQFAVALADVFDLPRQLILPASIDESHLSAPRPRNTSLNSHKVQQALRRQMPGLREGLEHFKELRESGFLAILLAGRGG